MATVTGIPQEPVVDDVPASTSAAASRSREREPLLGSGTRVNEPLLGKPGDVTQEETAWIQNNLITGELKPTAMSDKCLCIANMTPRNGFCRPGGHLDCELRMGLSILEDTAP